MQLSVVCLCLLHVNLRGLSAVFCRCACFMCIDVAVLYMLVAHLLLWLVRGSLFVIAFVWCVVLPLVLFHEYCNFACAMCVSVCLSMCLFDVLLVSRFCTLLLYMCLCGLRVAFGLSMTSVSIVAFSLLCNCRLQHCVCGLCVTFCLSTCLLQCCVCFVLVFLFVNVCA